MFYEMAGAHTCLTKGEEGQREGEEVGGTCQTSNWAAYILYIAYIGLHWLTLLTLDHTAYIC